MAIAGPSRLLFVRPSKLPTGRPTTPAFPRHRRTLFSFKHAVPDTKDDLKPLLEQDNLFHKFSESPFQDLRERAQRIKSLAYCPVNLRDGIRKHVEFECPYCGWPTHATQQDWEEDSEHDRYWPRLREANEDEHDVRSGRKFTEAEMPAPMDVEEAISLANWDVFFYTRGFRAMTAREQRHVTKLLTFPVTIAAALHSDSPYNLRNQRLTTEGQRSMMALRHSINKPRGYKPTLRERPMLPIRIIVIGARAESSLDAYFWQQMAFLFPKTSFQVYFIGPEVTFQPGYEGSTDKYGVNSYTRIVSDKLSMTTLQCRYEEIHEALAPFDPWYDVFFSFSPGFGFPTPREPDRVQAETNWHEALVQILDTKCALFCTGFSPADVERDVLALDSVDKIADEFDWILTPGENVFKSGKWEVAEFDPRVIAQSNWGLWGIRGKLYEVGETYEGKITLT